jgi:molybdenum cofactor cytidylyltransferase
VPVTLVGKLVEIYRSQPVEIVAPQVQDRRANPVLFDRSVFSDLLALQGDTGGRAVFSHHTVTWLPWLDDSLLLDIDTWEDYQRLLALP